MQKEATLERTKGKIERMDVETETGLHQGTQSALLFCDRRERGQEVDNQFDCIFRGKRCGSSCLMDLLHIERRRQKHLLSQRLGNSLGGIRNWQRMGESWGYLLQAVTPRVEPEKWVESQCLKAGSEAPVSNGMKLQSPAQPLTPSRRGVQLN